MKIIAKINPKHLFRSKKRLSVSRSRSDPASFSYGSSSSESSGGKSTPTSVLPSSSQEISGDWFEEISPAASDLCFELVQAFKLMDRDRDGKITKKELESLLSRVSAEPLPSEEELAVMLNEMDRDGDGCISLEEFGAVSSAFGPPACDSELRYAFGFFDADGDGRITAEDLHSGFAAIGDRCSLEECRRMISGVDSKGDGFVCFEDFTRMMEKQR